MKREKGRKGKDTDGPERKDKERMRGGDIRGRKKRNVRKGGINKRNAD